MEVKVKNKKKSKKAATSTVGVTKTRIAAKNTLFPEKVAKAKEILSKTKFLDGRG